MPLSLLRQRQTATEVLSSTLLRQVGSCFEKHGFYQRSLPEVVSPRSNSLNVFALIYGIMGYLSNANVLDF